jgi:hypothetical protein
VALIVPWLVLTFHRVFAASVGTKALSGEMLSTGIHVNSLKSECDDARAAFIKVVHRRCECTEPAGRVKQDVAVFILES